MNILGLEIGIFIDFTWEGGMSFFHNYTFEYFIPS